VLVAAGVVVDIAINGVLVANKAITNLLPYLVDRVTIPKYLAVVALAVALWAWLTGRRRDTFGLLVLTSALIFWAGLNGLGHWYPAAQTSSQLEADLLSWAQTNASLSILILPTIGIIGLVVERAKKRAANFK
jgi:hypothetical protein